MKKEETPQDPSALDKYTKEVCYVKNAEGKYDTCLSRGWQVKALAQDYAWKDINENLESARSLVEKGKRSPIYFHMQKHMMTVSLLSSYVNINIFRVKLHLYPFVYKRLNRKTLQCYANVFKTTVEELDKLQ